jgi:hypothetical protein
MVLNLFSPARFPGEGGVYDTARIACPLLIAAFEGSGLMMTNVQADFSPPERTDAGSRRAAPTTAATVDCTTVGHVVQQIV